MATQLWPPGTSGFRRYGPCGRDVEGHRTYHIVFLVKASNVGEGPAFAMTTPGLPTRGATWFVQNDVDVWAWCTGEQDVKRVSVDNSPELYWEVEMVFTTKPPEPSKSRCQLTEIQNPLLEPAKISGTFVKYVEEATKDRFGVFLKNSAHEQIRGPQVEFDVSRPSIRIEQNIFPLRLDLLAAMRDTVNVAPMWGLPARCVKLSSISWERKFYGVCLYYYTRTLEFEVNAETFDRDVLDEGTKALNGGWDGVTGAWVIRPLPDGTLPDITNPSHFVRFLDRENNPMRVILNGFGLPVGAVISGMFGPTTTVSCCAGPIAHNLRATVTDPVVGCETCLPESFTMALVDGTTNTWLGDMTAENPLSCVGELQLTCGVVSDGPEDFELSGECIESVTLTASACDPFSLTYFVQFKPECCDGAATITIALEPISTVPGHRHIEKYAESNFFLLGIPAVF